LINSACLYMWAVHKIKLMVMECVVCSKKVMFSAAVTNYFLLLENKCYIITGTSRCCLFILSNNGTCFYCLETIMI
jgi:hypothetical protein